jgi:hypothetical protein
MPTAVRRVKSGIRPQSDSLKALAFGLGLFLGVTAAFELRARQ